MTSRGRGRAIDAHFHPSKEVLDLEAAASEKCGWAVKAVSNAFTKGLDRVFQKAFAASRLAQFISREDPVYATLLEGMEDDQLARVLVGNWTLAHTIATQSRFWLEEAIIDLLRERASGDVLKPEIFSLKMLADSWHTRGMSIWNVGENWRAELHGKGAWRPFIQEGALDAIEAIVNSDERQYESFMAAARRNGRAAVFAGLGPREDQNELTRISASHSGKAMTVTLRCNLLFIEPEGTGGDPAAWAIRYINPTTFGQASVIRGERVNLLRLYAYLVQEKPFRSPRRIRVIAADLVPRRTSSDPPRERAFFSELTRWESSQLWDFLDVPFAAVTAGIRHAGAEMRDKLEREHADLLS